ncbi:roadblock/LC7 domain-containing protein [candidate division WOR-3 bacterium]|nr:roadblock/LC7 domain-containing protein [candidate division WOR-3 bacterium]
MDEIPEVKEPSEDSLTEVLNKELDAFKADYPEISSAAIVSLDGFLMAVRPKGSADERLAAMSAFLLNSVRKAGDGLGWSKPGYILVQHSSGYLMAAEAGKTIIALAAGPKVKLGLLLYDLQESAKRLKMIG